jgi:hypothetical protein
VAPETLNPRLIHLRRSTPWLRSTIWELQATAFAFSAEQLRSGSAVLVLSRHVGALDQPDGLAVADHQFQRGEVAHGSG